MSSNDDLKDSPPVDSLVIPFDDQEVIVDGDDQNLGPTESSLAYEGSVYSWENINVHLRKPGFDPPPKKASTRPVKGRCCKKMKTANKQILTNVTGIVRPGQMLALMGASGAGKTTLLNVLHYNSGNMYIEGDRCINGIPVDSTTISRISAYVQQEDLFIPTLTVREHLMFTARIRMDRKLSFKERVRRVDEAIHDLGLSKCKNSKIGDPAVEKGISGGEMKRLAFASEMLTDPSILFADEPTSGLDSFMAQSVVEVMLKMAKMGKSVICTIHQPASEVFEMFDHIYLLSGGRVAFTGTIDEARDFFTEVGYPCPLNHNPADFFIFTLAIVPGEEEACRDRATAICDAFSTSAKAMKIEESAKYRAASTDGKRGLKKMCCQQGFCAKCCQTYRANWFIQFYALIIRSFISTYREPMLFLARLVQTVVLAITVGLVFFRQPMNQAGIKNISGCLFILVMNMTIMNCFGVIFVFAAELPIFLREHWNGMYRADAYFLAKTTVEMPFITAYALLFNSILYYMVGLRGSFFDEHFLICGAACVMVANVSCSFGYLMSCVSKNLVVALSISPPILVPIFLFSGFFLRDESTPEYWKWAKYITWYYYSCEILFVNQWNNVTNIENEGTQELFLGDGEQVLEYFGYKAGNMKMDLLLLFVLMVVLRVLAYLALLWKTYGRGT